jgi:hypothetical protein
VNLTRLNWAEIPRIGDEDWIMRNELSGGKRAEAYEAVVRAYRQLAAQLRAQGMSEIADRFSYRAQVLQRHVLSIRRQWGRWFGTWLLDAVSGHGYKPMRSIITYAVVVGVFAVFFFFGGSAHGQPMSWNESLVVSMTAFHGRGFFGSAFRPGDPEAAGAAVEALLGLLIEIAFIATFTQRFFAR